jgi:hypothetical protein
VISWFLNLFFQIQLVPPHAGLLRLAHSKLNARHVDPLCRAIFAAKERADSRADTDADWYGDTYADADREVARGGEGRSRGITGLDLRGNILDAAAVTQLVQCLAVGLHSLPGVRLVSWNILADWLSSIEPCFDAQ